MKFKLTKLLGWTLVCSIFLITSCRKTDEMKITAGTAIVNVNLEGDRFEGIQTRENLSAKEMGNVQNIPAVQRQELPLNNGFTLIAELTPITATLNDPQSATKTMAAAGGASMANAIRYKVLVFKATGEYVTERDYVRGREAETAALKLDGGERYTFIAYSVNSQTILPVMSFSDTRRKTLANAHIAGLAGDVDLMYYKRENMQLTASETNYLSVLLVHKLSQVNVTLDASAMGHRITAIEAMIDQHYPAYDVKLLSGELMRTGTVGNAPIVFTNLNSPKVSSIAKIINGGANKSSFIISFLKLGELIAISNHIAFDQLEMVQGYSYNLKLNVKSSLVPDNLDTDKDGLSDYAEDRIVGLDKYNGEDVKKLDAFSVLTIRRNNDVTVQVPFYQTTYYQSHFCKPPEPTFNRQELSDTEIALINDTYSKWLKILRTAEFQDYILTKPAGREQGLIFIEKAKNLKRGILYRSDPNSQDAVGTSNRWNVISISHWAMTPPYTDYLNNIPHEFIHHLDYGHEYDYAYGGGFKAREMLLNKKYDYEVYDLEKKWLYQ